MFALKSPKKHTQEVDRTQVLGLQDQLNYDIIPLCTKKKTCPYVQMSIPVLAEEFIIIFNFITTFYNQISCITIKYNLCFNNSLATDYGESDLQRLLAFQDPNMFSVAYVLPKNPAKSKALYNILQHTGFLLRGVVSLPPNTQARRKPIIGCPRLFIRYTRILSCYPYLEAISSVSNLRMHYEVATRDTFICQLPNNIP